MSNGKLSDNAIIIAEDRYLMEDEDWEACANRVGQVIAAAENSHMIKYAQKFADIIFNLDFLPGGRILRNAGRQRGSLFNCYHLPIGDSREEIGQYYKDSLILWGEGGGVGVNMSNLRPKGSAIKGVGGSSSGPVSFLVASDAIAETIESGGSRRAAALALMHVSHPDIIDFIDAKLKHGVLSHYNISVAVNDKFLEAVEADSEWEYKFAQQSCGKVKAIEIWNKIIENMVDCAEPGILNWDNLVKNNSYYYDPILGVNPCGEAVLSPYDVCDLGSLVLPNFITGNVNTNWKKLEETIKLAVRFLDDVIDVNKYVLKEIDIKAHNSRRIGLGVMGLAEYLFAKTMCYGSKKAIAEVEKLMRFIRDVTYETLVELASEKGAFPKFDPVAYGKASFIRKLPVSLRMKIKENGSRCVTGLAVAPTGTISLLADVTSGIEPLFRKAYKRNDRISDRMYVHPIYKDILETKSKTPEWFVDTDDLNPEDHFEMQAIVQRYVDGAVSKCISLDSRVLTDNGYVELKDFSDNREKNVFSDLNIDFCVFTEGKRIKPTSFYYNGVVHGKHIETKNGFNLDGSNIHRIKVLSKDHNEIWKRMDELVVGDVAIIPLDTCIVDSSKNSYIDNNYEKSGRYVKDVELPNKVTKDLCWWLGCLVADGHVVDGSYEIGITQSLNKSNDVINKFKNVSKKLFGVEFDLVLDKRCDNLYNVYFNSIKLYDWLVRGLKFSKENIPSIILSSGKLMKRSFIEGLTLDGFVTKDDHICLKTDKSENLIQQLQLLCCEIGIPTYITTKFDAKYNRFYYNLFVQSDGVGCLKNFVFPEPFKQNRFKVVLNKNKYIRRNVFMFSNGNIPINNDFLNKISDIEKQVINSPRLYNIFHHIYNNAKQHMYLSLDAIMTIYSFIGEIPPVFNNKYLLSEILCVNNIEIETADIEVPYTHNYIANGFISHNTINMPAGTTSEELSKLMLEYVHDLKGVTVYVDGSREGQILNKVSEKEIKEFLKENKTTDASSEESVQCINGTCEM